MDKENPLTQPSITEHKIGSTIFVVNASHKADAQEGLVDKVVRLIENDNRCADTQAHR